MINSRYNKYSSNDGYSYNFTRYPEVQLNDIDFIIINVIQSDRLDLLAKKYFGNSKLWWIIAMVNNISGDSVFVQVGTQLYIPKDYYNYVY